MSSFQAIFVDRDGVINRERRDYVKSWDEFIFLPGALTALQRLAALDLPILMVTNQSAIGRGRVSAAKIAVIHTHMEAAITKAGGRVDQVYHCPHRPDEGCVCRKPAPGLLLQAARDYGLELERCLFIGDAVTDAMAAHAAGCHAILVRSGRQGAQLTSLVARARRDGTITQEVLPICPDLAAATVLIQHLLDTDSVQGT